MTDKADFTEEEWTRLKRAPFVAGMAISLADPGGPIELVKETAATLKTVAAAADHGGLVGALATEVSAESKERKNPLSGFKAKGALAGQEILEELGAVNGIVSAKASPEDADAYRAWLNAAAQEAANAAKEGGFFGFHAVRVSEGEQRMLDKLGEVLAPPTLGSRLTTTQEVIMRRIAGLAGAAVLLVIALVVAATGAATGSGGHDHTARARPSASSSGPRPTRASTSVTTGDSIGDLLAFGNELFDHRNQRKVGTDQGSCVRTVVGKAYECSWTNSLAKGQITVQGPFLDAGDSVMAITGGTGAYRNARGTMALHARSATEFDFTFHLSK